MKVPTPYLQNIRDLIQNAEKFSAQQSVATLKTDHLAFDALDMTIARICRYLNRLNELFSDRYPELNLIHFPSLHVLQHTSLMDHQPATVFQACQIDLPKLKPLILSSLKPIASPELAEGETQKAKNTQE